MLPEAARTIAYGRATDATSTLRRPVAGLRRSTRPGLFRTRSNAPDGSRSIEVGWTNTSGFAGAGRTRTDPSRDAFPPALAVSRHSPADGKTSLARYAPRRPEARTWIRRPPEAVTQTAPAYEAGRTVRRTVHARPATGAGPFPLSVTRTGSAADAEQTNTAKSTTAPAERFMWIQTPRRGLGLHNWVMPSRASIGVAAVAVAAGLWGMDALIRRPLARATEPATIVFGEHVVLVALLFPVVLAALPALFRAGPRFVAAGIVIGA